MTLARRHGIPRFRPQARVLGGEVNVELQRFAQRRYQRGVRVTLVPKNERMKAQKEPLERCVSSGDLGAPDRRARLRKSLRGGELAFDLRHKNGGIGIQGIRDIRNDGRSLARLNLGIDLADELVTANKLAVIFRHGQGLGVTGGRSFRRPRSCLRRHIRRHETTSVPVVIDRILGAERGRVTGLVRVLATRNVRVRYRGSSLGILWSVSNPLLMTVVYAVVFGHTFSAYYGGSKLRYVAALFVGLATMNFFSTSTFQALHAVVANGILLNKMRVPSIVFPVSTVLANAFQLLFGTLPVFLLIALVVGHDPLWMPFIVVPLLALVCLSMGVSLAVSAIYVFYRDIPYLYELAYFALFVATPVFYPLEIIEPRYRPFIEYNPLSLIVEQLRAVAVLGTAPSLLASTLAAASGLIVLVLGIVIFRRASAAFMDYL